MEINHLLLFQKQMRRRTWLENSRTFRNWLATLKPLVNFKMRTYSTSWRRSPPSPSKPWQGGWQWSRRWPSPSYFGVEGNPLQKELSCCFNTFKKAARSAKYILKGIVFPESTFVFDKMQCLSANFDHIMDSTKLFFKWNFYHLWSFLSICFGAEKWMQPMMRPQNHTYYLYFWKVYVHIHNIQTWKIKVFWLHCINLLPTVEAYLSTFVILLSFPSTTDSIVIDCISLRWSKKSEMFFSNLIRSVLE